MSCMFPWEAKVACIQYFILYISSRILFSANLCLKAWDPVISHTNGTLSLRVDGT